MEDIGIQTSPPSSESRQIQSLSTDLSLPENAMRTATLGERAPVASRRSCTVQGVLSGGVAKVERGNAAIRARVRMTRAKQVFIADRSGRVRGLARTRSATCGAGSLHRRV